MQKSKLFFSAPNCRLINKVVIYHPTLKAKIELKCFFQTISQYYRVYQFSESRTDFLVCQQDWSCTIRIFYGFSNIHIKKYSKTDISIHGNRLWVPLHWSVVLIRRSEHAQMYNKGLLHSQALINFNGTGHTEQELLFVHWSRLNQKSFIQYMYLHSCT